MYAVAIWKHGNKEYMPMGNDGLQRLHNKSPRGWHQETAPIRFFAYEVLVVPDFTQEMCEMDMDKLVAYVRKHYVFRLK